MTPIRVLVVDDSATMRALLRRALVADPELDVVGEACDPADARAKIKALDPDVVTLDVEMPGMNGLEFLEKIMRLRPTPVVMVSNLTGPGASASIEALAIGAFDCVAKPNALQGDTFATLPALLKAAAATKRRMAFREAPTRAAAAPAPSPAAAPARAENRERWPDLIALGASTGGVEALLTVLADFPANCPPTLIVQHLPAAFTKSFAARLNNVCRAEVSDAANGDVLAEGRVYLAPGGFHLSVAGVGAGRRCVLDASDPVQGHRPSVDVMMRSVARLYGGRAAGAVLTGMGRDGAEGLLDMRRAGARTMAQDEATSLVYGMPRVAHEIGAAEKRVPLARVARELFA